MKILRDHLLREFAAPFCSTLLVLLFIFLAGRGIVQMADLIFNKSVDVFLVLQLLFYSAPFLLTFAIPMAILVALLTAFGKLSYDNEILAAKASGISLVRLTAPLFALVIVLCVCSFLLSDRIASESHFRYRKTLAQIGIENPSAALEEGTFIKRFKNFIIFIYEIDGNKLKGVRIYQPQEGKSTRTIIAQKGELISIPEKGVVKLKLSQGTSDEPDPKVPSKMYKLNFKYYDLPLNVAELQNARALEKKPKEMSIRELKEQIEYLKETKIDDIYPVTTEIHNKIALSMSGIAFFLIAVPLGITSRRNDKSISYAISLGLMVVYWVLLIGGKALAQKGVVPPLPAMQFANLVVGGMGLFLFNKMAKA